MLRKLAALIVLLLAPQVAHCALEISEPDPRLRAGTELLNRAHAAHAARDHAQASALYQSALAAFETGLGAENRELDRYLNEIGSAHQVMDEYARALPLFHRSVAIREKALGPHHIAVARALAPLTNVYVWLNDYSNGIPAIHRSIAIFEKENAHRDLAHALLLHALLLESKGDFEEGVALIHRALETFAQHGAGDVDRLRYATGLHVLGLLQEHLGSYKTALSAAQLSLSVREKLLPPEHFYIAQSLNLQALLHTRLGNAAAAQPLFERAMHIAVNIKSMEELWRAQDGLRIAMALQKQPALGIFFGKQAVNTVQRMRAGLTALESAVQKNFLGDKAGVYRGLADLLIDQGRLPEAQQVMAMLKEEEYFDFIRRDGKQDARTTEVAFNAGEEPWRKRYGEISSRLGSLGAELAELDRKARSGLSDAESARREQLRGDRKVAQQAFDAFLGDFMRELSGSSAQRNRDVGERGLSNLRSLQGTLGSLGNNVVAVHYLVGEERLRILVTTPSIQVARTSAVSAKDLNQKIAFLQSQLQDPRLNPLPMAQELYKLLIAPIAEDLQQAKAQTLMVSLDGTLRYIPLAALHDGTNFVVEKFRLAIFTEAAKDKLKDVPQATWRVAALGLTAAKPGFSALPSVKGELEGILKSGTHAGMPGEMHLDEAFTSRRMRDVLDKAYPVLHVASHFKFQPGTEANSFLLLGDGNRLTLKDIKEDDYRFNDVDLMTLSACETAVGGGKDANGMEIEGLGALVQKQGAKAVIATLWPVADESTGLLMQRFYQVRESGKLTKAEALRQAQIEFIQVRHTPGADAAQRGLSTPNAPKPASSYTHPYYWAPFILMGNWL